MTDVVLPSVLWFAAVLLSLVPAYFIYKGIGKAGESYAMLKGKGFQFGGAAAFYMSILLMGRSFIPSYDLVRLTNEQKKLKEELVQLTKEWTINGEVQIDRELFHRKGVGIVVFVDEPRRPVPKTLQSATFTISLRQTKPGRFPKIYVQPIIGPHMAYDVDIDDWQKKGYIKRDEDTLTITKKIELVKYDSESYEKKVKTVASEQVLPLPPKYQQSAGEKSSWDR